MPDQGPSTNLSIDNWLLSPLSALLPGWEQTLRTASTRLQATVSCDRNVAEPVSTHSYAARSLSLWCHVERRRGLICDIAVGRPDHMIGSAGRQCDAEFKLAIIRIDEDVRLTRNRCESTASNAHLQRNASEKMRRDVVRRILRRDDDVKRHDRVSGGRRDAGVIEHSAFDNDITRVGVNRARTRTDVDRFGRMRSNEKSERALIRRDIGVRSPEGARSGLETYACRRRTDRERSA